MRGVHLRYCPFAVTVPSAEKLSTLSVCLEYIWRTVSVLTVGIEVEWGIRAIAQKSTKTIVAGAAIVILRLDSDGCGARLVCGVE